MADDAVVAFLNKVAEDPSLRTQAKEAYRAHGVDGLVQLGEENGEDFNAHALEEVISPSHLETGAAGTSIGWN